MRRFFRRLAAPRAVLPVLRVVRAVDVIVMPERRKALRAYIVAYRTYEPLLPIGLAARFLGDGYSRADVRRLVCARAARTLAEMRLRVALPLDGKLAHVIRRDDGYIERRGRRRAAFRICKRYDLLSDLERTDVRRPARYGAAAAVRVCRVYRHAVRIDYIALDKDRRIGNDLDGAEPVSAARRERDARERRGKH